MMREVIYIFDGYLTDLTDTEIVRQSDFSYLVSFEKLTDLTDLTLFLCISFIHTVLYRDKPRFCENRQIRQKPTTSERSA